MKKMGQDLNYWPGYVDALMNILLNLLFLVGLFIVGLICLNMEIMQEQQKLAVLEAEERLLSEQTLANAGTSVQKPSQNHEGSANDVVPIIEEIHLGQRSAATTDVVDISPHIQHGDMSNIDAFAGSLVKGVVLSRLAFPEQTFNWPQNKPLIPLQIQKGERYWLLNFTDVENPRLLREAYSRVMSLRLAYQNAGHDVQNLSVRIAPLPVDKFATGQFENTVFIIKQTRN